jgi:hypothetical protein
VVLEASIDNRISIHYHIEQCVSLGFPGLSQLAAPAGVLRGFGFKTELVTFIEICAKC